MISRQLRQGPSIHARQVAGDLLDPIETDGTIDRGCDNHIALYCFAGFEAVRVSLALNGCGWTITLRYTPTNQLQCPSRSFNANVVLVLARLGEMEADGYVG